MARGGDTAAILGVSLREGDPLQVIRTLESGLPSQSLKRFKDATGLTDDEVATLLRIGGRTLTRIRGSRAQRLSPDLSDRLYAVASLYALAEDVFGAHDAAIGWMTEPQYALGGHSPLELMATELGRARVRQLLMQIEHGMLA